MGLDQFIKQLEGVLADYRALVQRSKQSDLSDQPKSERQALVTRAVAAIHRIAGSTSAYASDVSTIRAHMPHLHVHTSSVMGVAEALLSDLKNGLVQTLAEVAHADVFADFLGMSQHLLDSNYKDASAVIAGSSLEAHLRALCVKNGIDTDQTKAGDTFPKKADTLNAELVAAGVYGKLDQKSVTAWLDLRNKAAHGKYTEYQAGQVALLVAGVREFIARNPA